MHTVITPPTRDSPIVSRGRQWRGNGGARPNGTEGANPERTKSADSLYLRTLGCRYRTCRDAIPSAFLHAEGLTGVTPRSALLHNHLLHTTSVVTQRDEWMIGTAGFEPATPSTLFRYARGGRRPRSRFLRFSGRRTDRVRYRIRDFLRFNSSATEARPRPAEIAYIGAAGDYSSCFVRTGAPLMRPVYPSRSPPTTNPRSVISYSRYALLCWLPRIFTTAATFLSSLSTST
jgi:hypothetical protein